MIVDTYTTMNIRLSQEECSILEEAFNILRKINQEIDECHNIDEARLSDNSDADLLNKIENELNELSYSVEF